MKTNSAVRLHWKCIYIYIYIYQLLVIEIKEMLPYVRAKFRKVTKIMKSTKVQTLGGNIGTFGLETPLHAYVLGIYRTSFQHNLHCFIDACVHVVNDYIVSNKPV